MANGGVERGYLAEGDEVRASKKGARRGKGGLDNAPRGERRGHSLRWKNEEIGRSLRVEPEP